MMIRARTLQKFNHYNEFEQNSAKDTKFQILKQETMRIDPKLMTPDQSKFDILALQINEDDNLCSPECVPLIYNVTLSSIHGNIFINMGNNENIASEHHSSFSIKESKNQLNMNQVQFTGHLDAANHALKNLVFEPQCPLDADNIV